jgi:hypothetical protein
MPIFLTARPAGFTTSDAAMPAGAATTTAEHRQTPGDASTAGGTSEDSATRDESQSASGVQRLDRTARGKLIVVLDNGETWRQLDSDNTTVPVPDNPTGMTATIRQGLFGSWSIELSGTGRPFRAVRMD